MNNKKHQQELDELVSRIYDAAADMMTDYCEKTYGSSSENTIEQQLDDYINVAQRASSYLLGNALAMIDPEQDEELIKESVNRIQAVAEYVRARAQEPDLKN